LIALMQTPHRFRSKRQLWTYSGLGIETHDSAQCRYVGGQLQRSKKPQQIRGLNQNHNHEMKEIFKGAATRASCGVGPLRDFYVALLAKGMKPEIARLTFARKIAAIESSDRFVASAAASVERTSSRAGVAPAEVQRLSRRTVTTVAIR
jgi:hypothetical protein